ncbi:MAG: hypothetical protein ACK4GT_08405 [Pararhodobacter sp.]
MLRRLALTAGVVLGLTGTALATTLPGASAPAFTAALDDWLADDEAAALPALAALATGGNSAARLLLAQIDKMPALQGPYLAHLPRAQRVALMRAPGGMSGLSWLTQAAGLPLADAWLALRHPGAGPELIAAFAALDEPRAARETFVTLAAREVQALATLDPVTADPEFLYLLWRLGDEDRRATVRALVPDGHPQRRMIGDRVPEGALAHWLAESEVAEPLAALCRAICGDEVPVCLTTAYQALGSHEALLTLGTPAEVLIPQGDFLDSPRGQASVMRRVLMSVPMRGRRAMLARVTAQSECLGTALVAQNERFRPPLYGVPNGAQPPAVTPAVTP